MLSGRLQDSRGPLHWIKVKKPFRRLLPKLAHQDCRLSERFDFHKIATQGGLLRISERAPARTRVGSIQPRARACISSVRASKNFPRKAGLWLCKRNGGEHARWFVRFSRSPVCIGCEQLARDTAKSREGWRSTGPAVVGGDAESERRHKKASTDTRLSDVGIS